MVKRTIFMLFVSALTVGFFISPVTAQEAVRTKSDLLRDLVMVLQVRENAVKLFDTTIGEMKNQYPQMIAGVVDADPELTPEQRQKMKATANEGIPRFSTLLQERIKQRIDFGQFVEEISYALYDKYFTEAEIKDLTAFYKSPTGKKAITVMPQLFAESVRQGSERIGPIIVKAVNEIIAEERDRMKREIK
jgi:uncharacterized protein